MHECVFFFYHASFPVLFVHFCSKINEINFLSHVSSSEVKTMGWEDLPTILLEEIFSYLSLTHRYYASQVCRTWYVDACLLHRDRKSLLGMKYFIRQSFGILSYSMV